MAITGSPAFPADVAQCARRRAPAVQLVAGVARQVKSPDTVGDIYQTRAVYAVPGAASPIILVLQKLVGGAEDFVAQAGGFYLYGNKVQVFFMYQARVAFGH